MIQYVQCTLLLPCYNTKKVLRLRPFQDVNIEGQDLVNDLRYVFNNFLLIDLTKTGKLHQCAYVIFPI